MKKILRPLIAVVLATIIALAFASCTKVEGLTENDDWNNNISVYQRMMEKAHTELISYTSEEQALSADIKQSDNYLSLNGTWDFTLALTTKDVVADFMKTSFVYPDENTISMDTILYWDEIQVPGTWELQGWDVPMYTNNSRYPWTNDIKPANNSKTYLPIGLYRKEIDIPADWKDENVFINFEGVASAFYVYVNGYMIGYGEDTYTSSEFYISPYLKAGEKNLISLKVFKFADSSWVEAQDSMKLGGVYRDVYLYSTPVIRISDVSIVTTLDNQYENALLNFNVVTANYGSSSPKGYTVSTTIYDAEGKVFSKETKMNGSINFEVTQSGNAYLGKIGGRTSLVKPHLWNAEDPYLYTLVVKLFDNNDKLVDIVSQKFGIVVAGFKADDEGRQTFIVNGQPVTLYGINYNEHDADTGSTISYETLLADVKLMKELNINAIRSPGRPLSIDLLNLCDEYGIYVIDDMDMCSTPYSRQDEQSIPGSQSIWQSNVVNRLINVLERDKNHPSVVMWSLGTQSGEGDNITALRNYLLQQDKRLLIYDDYVNASDLTVAYKWDLTSIREYISELNNKKPLIIQTNDMGYLNGAGNLATWVELYTEYDRLQGGFLANWIDYAIYYPVEGTMKEAKKNTPVATNPDAYELTYAGSWGEQISSGFDGLRGILNADRTLQTDAVEFRNAYAPIYVKASSLEEGKFVIRNRFTFTTVSSDDYSIIFKLSDGTNDVKTEQIPSFEIAPGEQIEYTFDYGTLEENVEYFVSFEVVYKTAPVWNKEATNLRMAYRQYDLTDYEVMNKTVEVNPTGDPFSYTSYYTPTVITSAYDLVKTGSIWITNTSEKNLNECYKLMYVVYETNNNEQFIIEGTKDIWQSPGKIVYQYGEIENFNVPAHTAYTEIKLPLNVKAVKNGTYSVDVLLITKESVGDVPANNAILFTFDEETLGEKIPFEVDESRTPEPVLDENGNQMFDQDVLLKIMRGGDPIFDPETALDPGIDDLEYLEFNSFITIDNGKVKITINTDTGLITEYSVDGVDIFAKNVNSPVGNFTRQPSGGDLTSEVSASKNNSTLSSISRNTDSKKLIDGIKITKVSDDHYRFEMDYTIATYSYALFGSTNLNSNYVVTYDIYGDGQIVVGVAYSPSLFANYLPYEISSVITLSDNFKTVTWYGKGPGENFKDKTADAYMGLFSDVAITDMISDYLRSTEESTRQGVRWAVFKDEEGNGFLLTSDTNTFALNVSKWNPWDSVSYTRTRLSSTRTVVRVITDSRGINTGNIADSDYYEDPAYVSPGASYSYSFKISPISKTENAAEKAQEYITTELPAVTALELENGKVYSLVNIGDITSYLTVKTNTVDKSTSVVIAAGTGSANQLWKTENADSTGVNDIYRILSLGANKYLTASATETPKGAYSIEMGLSDKIDVTGQAYGRDSRNELSIAGIGTSVYQVGYEGVFEMGSKLAVMARLGKTESCWIFEPVEGQDDVYIIKNAKSGYYMTVADGFTFRNPVVSNAYERFTKYDPSTDWSTYEGIMSAEPITDFDAYVEEVGRYGVSWFPIEGLVTTWQLLPGDTQRWKFDSVGENEFTITNSSTGKALSVVDGAVVEQALTGSEEQKWKAYENDGLYGLINEATGLALSTTVNSDGNVVLILSEWKESPNQLWSLSSEDTLKVNIEAGDSWFKKPE